jgi:hypothetical protein
MILRARLMNSLQQCIDNLLSLCARERHLFNELSDFYRKFSMAIAR